ncbi:MAG TPA: TIGR00730 family Rossman fold protein [Alphaproteobacteria bacterium]|nr:TIGR00730 family Rossman fold protein [Alphaproteobacteria bacterium]
MTADNAEQKASASYRLPVADSDFLLSDSMRGVRFMLEYAKAEERLRAWGIRSTIVVFGSARVMPGGSASEAAATAPLPVGRPAPGARAARWYEEARRFGRIASERGGALNPVGGCRDNVIATGGGPGIMEAANRGAAEAGAPTIGFNITLPHEQEPNAYTTPDLTFLFHYFAMRKMHLAMRANALVVFPGGFGTLDELFELLTLRQTGKAPPMPIVLFDRAYWTRIVNFEAFLEEGMISEADLDLFDFADDAEAAWRCLVRRGLKAHGESRPAADGDGRPTN